MSQKGFTLVANISSDHPEKLEPILSELIGVDGIIKTEDGFMVHTTILGESAEDMNNSLLTKIRVLDPTAKLHAVWSHENDKKQIIDFVQGM